MSKEENLISARSGSGKTYTIDELLARMEPQYQEDKKTMRQCIAGLTGYAAQLAAQSQEEPLLRLQRMLVEMAEFWGLAENDTPKGFQDMRQQFTDAFEHMVSDARSSGSAPELSDEDKKHILDGLELYAQEMRSNDPELEDWAVECDILAEELEEQWQIENAERTTSISIQLGGM